MKGCGKRYVSNIFKVDVCCQLLCDFFIGIFSHFGIYDSTSWGVIVRLIGCVVAFDEDAGDENDDEDENQQSDDFGEEIQVALRFNVVLGSLSAAGG